ncbi:YmfL family putative regulatory protein [Massilia sp. DD77]|uniref:YmfL family putative regulatory protein n=1 Tax=Massilia sp. DD77 TaxID=3109349 RepID=UPI002FFED826
MNIRQSFLSMIKAFPGGWDAIAAALGMSRDALENRVYERKGQGVTVDTALQIQAFSQCTHFAEAVATASGGTFIKLPGDLAEDNELLMAKFQSLYAELGQFSKDFSAATADDLIDKREQMLLEHDVAQLHKVLAELMALTLRIYAPQGGKEVE